MAMITAEARNVPENDAFDPEDVGLHGSSPPILIDPKLSAPSSPAPAPKRAEYDLGDGKAPSPRKIKKRRAETAPGKGDAAVAGLLDGSETPEAARMASQEIPLPGPGDEDVGYTNGHNENQMSFEKSEQSTDLTALAAGALRAFNGGELAPVVKSDSTVEGDLTKVSPDECSPQRQTTDGNHELAPIQVSSPKVEKGNNFTLPSISSQLGHLTHLAEAATANVEKAVNGAHTPSFSQSPPRPPLFPVHQQSSGHGHTSPPISPQDSFRREQPSPGMGMHQYYCPPRRPSQAADCPPFSNPADYTGSATETPNTDQSTSCGGIPSGINRMSIDGITNPQFGGFQCTFPGCTAQPFQTQYLLNSHANVHSSNRPHFCPVHGCPRSEGGKGFKRKNEMIRHGLVHESPGYVCPYCVDREHKYPRPDNLQRLEKPFLCASMSAICIVLMVSLLDMFECTMSTRTKTIRSYAKSFLRGLKDRVEGVDGAVGIFNELMPVESLFTAFFFLACVQE